jgi:DAACS family dicarboxylate/amino acid:cation (Na+ or H+) symporter
VSQPAPSSDRLATRILIGLGVGAVLGVVARGTGAASPAAAEAFRWFASQICDPLGQVFLRLLFFVVVPLVFASLALGVVQLGRLDRLGPLAGKTFALFGLNMAVGVALGLLMMNVLKPGARLDPAVKEQMLAQFAAKAGEYEAAAKSRQEEGVTLHTVVEMFMPRNLPLAVVGQNPARIGDVLPLILFALLVGAAGTQLEETRRRSLQQGLEVVCDLMTRIVHFALVLAPLAVPAMVFSTIVKFGADFLGALALFVAGVLAAIAVHLFGTMSVMVRVLGRRSPWEFFKVVRVVLVTAFSTSSSNATLPTSLQVAREHLGVSPATAGFVLPLGATMNMSGTALFEGCVVLFVAQVFGVELSLAQQVMLLLLAVLSAVAVSGIPGGALPLIVGLMINFGIPGEGIALVLGVDRLLDMARTTLNVGADLVTAVIVDERAAPPAATAGGPGAAP